MIVIYLIFLKNKINFVIFKKIYDKVILLLLYFNFFLNFYEILYIQIIEIYKIKIILIKIIKKQFVDWLKGGIYRK